MKFSPDGEKIKAGLGGVYESDAPVLRGNWLRGGPLVFQAASNSRSGPGYTVPVSRPFVSRNLKIGRAHPLRLHFVHARPFLRP
jgi:hypothetical protein